MLGGETFPPGEGVNGPQMWGSQADLGPPPRPLSRAVSPLLPLGLQITGPSSWPPSCPTHQPLEAQDTGGPACEACPLSPGCWLVCLKNLPHSLGLWAHRRHRSWASDKKRPAARDCYLNEIQMQRARSWRAQGGPHGVCIPCSTE